MKEKQIALFYKSLLGSTKKYAVWLTEELQGDLFSYAEASPIIFERYDIVVVLSGTYAGQMPLVTFLKKHWDDLRDNTVVAVAVGMVPNNDEQSKKSYELIPEDIRKKITYFKLPGKLFKVGPAGKVEKENLLPIIKSISQLKKATLLARRQK